MTQSSLMYYAYFRFYVDESEIIAGMDKFCTQWEHMFAVGYNYTEYKCFVDNIGGFEHWVGDMRGYISQTRETGFIDGSPSDAVFDQSLFMGAERIFTYDVMLLNGYKTDTKLIFRKITGKDAGMDHKVEFKNGLTQKITHPVMYTIDNSQIEIIKQSSAGFVDNSTVDEYEIMIESSTSTLTGTQHSINTATLSNLPLMFNKDRDDYCDLQVSGILVIGYVIIDIGSIFSNIAIDLFNYYRSGNYAQTWVYHSPSATGGWVQIGSTGANENDFVYTDVGIASRYVKIKVQCLAGTGTGRCDIYRLLCS